MLTIIVPDIEYFNEDTNEFFTVKGQILQLEHSLVSVAKWEANWNKPFLSSIEKTVAETLDYIHCMTITQNVDPRVYNNITQRIIEEVSAYIEKPMTATTFSKSDQKQNHEIVTAEIIYFWMVTFNIPPEYQKWHLNRLLTLINVCNLKNQKPKKLSAAEAAARNRELNAVRRAKMHSKG